MDSGGTWNFPPLILVLNCLCTFALNLSVFLVISRTSALTIRVTGVVRDWVVVLLSAVIFSDTKLTAINLIGYVIGTDTLYSIYALQQCNNLTSSQPTLSSQPFIWFKHSYSFPYSFIFYF